MVYYFPYSALSYAVRHGKLVLRVVAGRVKPSNLLNLLSGKLGGWSASLIRGYGRAFPAKRNGSIINVPIPKNYLGDGYLMNAKHSPEANLGMESGCIKLPNLVNIFRGKLSSRMISASPSVSAPSPLGDHVNHIVLGSTEDKVSRVDAWRIVACVTYDFINRTFSIMNSVGDSVCREVRLYALKVNIPVLTGALPGSGPYPASVRLGGFIDPFMEGRDFDVCKFRDWAH